MRDSIIPYTILEILKLFENIYEVRLFGWCLAKAQAAAKRYDKNLGNINIQFGLEAARVTFPARYLLQDGETNYSRIKDSFGLAKKVVETPMGAINIIAFPELKKVGRELYITFLIHQKMWYALLDFSKGYRIANLEVYMRFRSMYTPIMYLLISQQDSPFVVSVRYLREITGTLDRQSYDRSNNFRQKVIEAAKTELDRFSPWTFDYSMEKTGRSNGTVLMRPHTNAAYRADENPSDRALLLDAQRVRLDERIREYIQSSWEMTTQELEVVERYIPAHLTPEEVIQRLADIKTTMLRCQPANRKGYLVGALMKMSRQ